MRWEIKIYQYSFWSSVLEKPIIHVIIQGIVFTLNVEICTIEIIPWNFGNKTYNNVSMKNTFYFAMREHAMITARFFGGPIKTKEKCISCTTAEPHCK